MIQDPPVGTLVRRGSIYPPPAKLLAVDFDGTVVDHRYPKIGPEAPGAVDVLKGLVANQTGILLWTMRDGEDLLAAERWFEEREIPLYGANWNVEQQKWTTSPKVYAHLYIDDAALGVPMTKPPEFERPCVDWAKVRIVLTEMGWL